ncbi:hypothetical protein BEWA_006440 [Theileria equi strain WA]|uniref:Uncharacterized protein n=1 Tax=Theileria equi strain WA TaxID=1537102 RepID=L0B087_THEEQ|nr:hypothetical protein BEWA_006440 [Theileria equi strain WA]AFZ81235.1 hypothetical protein BEWA_006440 [Theileria equi strain WA]|eukprot:XP_004830901.1 hypothetical protein BEWA_006440 [Theileria equi strain WA]
MNLEKDMFLNHELFPEIRFYALKNKSLFGRVYSNELSRMFRARNSFINQDFFKHIDIYLSLETFNYDIESLPRFLESLDCPSDIPSSFFKRLDDLCRSSGRIRAINSTFEGITPKFSCDSISSKFPRLIVSVWGAIAYNTIMNGDNYLKATINNICEVKTIDMKDPSFEILKLKYNEDNLTYCNRMTTTVFNLFEQLYKLYKLIDDSPSVCDEDIDSKVSEADNLYSKILLPTDKTNFDELVALYHYSKQQILGNNDTQGLLAGFTEAIEYLNTKMQEHTFDRKNLKSFISLVCKPYMQSIMDFWSHNDEVYHKLDAIYKGVSESTGEYFQCFLPKSIIGTMYDCGLKNLCNIFDYKPEPQRDQTYCIMRGRNFSFLFDPDSVHTLEISQNLTK